MDGEPRNDGPEAPVGDDTGALPAAPDDAGRDGTDRDADGTDEVTADVPEDPAPPAEPSTSTSGSPAPRAWSRPVAVAASTVVALVLGFALTVQIRTTAEPDTQLGATREEDLVLILDELNTREEVLRRQIGETRQTIEDLSTGQQQSDTAVEEAQARAEAVGILNGTLPARGPGLRITVQDSDGAVPVSVLLDAIQELRGAGAEAIQVDGVRVVVSSAITGSPGMLRIDGTLLTTPYEIRAVGPAAPMEVALNVAGGFVADVSRAGATARITQDDSVVVDALVE